MSREDVARLAARLLYEQKVKEYKDAKEVAAASLGSNKLPSNYEVAVELDQLTDQLEGDARHKRLIEMRETALQIMKTLTVYKPKLIGSVWRGTARLGSDVDVVVYGDPEEIEHELTHNFTVNGRDTQRFTMEGLPRITTHIRLTVNGYDAEVVVRPTEDRDAYRVDRCETYGDQRRGLGEEELEKLMKADPLRRFVPRRRPK